MEMHKFLQLVASEQKTFSAKNDLDLPSFQSSVLTAQEAYRNSFISEFTPHNESVTGHRYIDMFTVGQLTDKGRRFINLP